MKSLKKCLHMVTFTCFENQFYCRVLNVLVVYLEGKVGSQTEENYNSSKMSNLERTNARTIGLVYSTIRYWWIGLIRLISTQTQRQTVEMCLSKTMLSEIMKPRLRAQFLNGILAVPTRREVGVRKNGGI